MKEKNWSYLAGLFDGEGCIHIAEVSFKDRPHGVQKAYRADIHITMTNREVIEWVAKNFGGVYYVQESVNPRWRNAYRWVPKGNKNKQNLLLGLLPYLIVKREVANIALEFLRLTGICPEERKRLATKARQLTQRGKSVETNTLDSQEKIESELVGDNESAVAVTQLA